MTAYHIITIHCDGIDCNEKIILPGCTIISDAEELSKQRGWTKTGLKNLCYKCSLETESENNE